MASGTFICDDWLALVRAIPVDTPTEERLVRIAAASRQALGVHVRFARIHGPRWEYLAGEQEDLPLSFASERIELGGGLGLISDLSKRVTQADRETVVAELRATLGGKHP